MLRPEPHRGDVVAAGAVVLATLVALVDVRLDGRWGDTALLAPAAGATAFVGALALRAPLEGRAPRPYQSVLYVVALVLAGLALHRLAPVLGADSSESTGAVAWIAAMLAIAAWRLATTRNSAICTLLGALATAVAAVAATLAVGHDDGLPSRWLTFGLVGLFALAAVIQRDRRPAHAVALANAGGVVIAWMAYLLPFDGPGAAWGWELFCFAAGFGLIGFGAVERQRGPASLGVLTLALTVLAAGEPGSLLGWPLALGLGAAILLIVGLRPSRPLPPEPDRPSSDVIALEPRP